MSDIKIYDEGKEVADTKRQDFVFTVGSGENIYKIDDEIIGMKKDETKEITKKYAKNDADPDLAGKTKKISVTVKAVKLRDLPALDDDFAQDCNEKYKTLDDMKADIKKNMEVAKERKLRELKNNSLLEQLVEKNPFEIPASMLAAELEGRWNMMAQQFQTTPEQLEKMITASGQTKEAMLKAEAYYLDKVAAETPDVRADRIAEVKAKLKDPSYLSEAVIQSAAENFLTSVGL